MDREKTIFFDIEIYLKKRIYENDLCDRKGFSGALDGKRALYFTLKFIKRLKKKYGVGDD